MIIVICSGAEGRLGECIVNDAGYLFYGAVFVVEYSGGLCMS